MALCEGWLDGIRNMEDEFVAVADAEAGGAEDGAPVVVPPDGKENGDVVCCLTSPNGERPLPPLVPVALPPPVLALLMEGKLKVGAELVAVVEDAGAA